MKYFAEVFKNVSINSGLKQTFGTSVVKSISVNDRREMFLALESSTLIPQNNYAQLKQQLAQGIPNLHTIHITPYYKIDNLSPSDFWRNLVEIVADESPFCSQILRFSEYDLTEKELLLKLAQGGEVLFSAKKFDKRIEQIARDNFGLNIYVKCESLPPSKRSKNIKQNELPKAWLEAKEQANKPQQTSEKPKRRSRGVKINEKLADAKDITLLNSELLQDNEIVIRGTVLKVEEREIKSGSILTIFDMTDGTSSITVKFFHDKDENFDEFLQKDACVTVRGIVQFDAYSKELTVMLREIAKSEKAAGRTDTAATKRIELHLHTQMSAMDAVNGIKDYVKRAAELGHTALAVTDHGVVQAFPDAMSAASKYGVKIIYGIEAYLTDDLSGVVQNDKKQEISGEFVVFDLETTGLKPDFCKIIEIGAVRVRNLEIIEKFSTFVDPEENIPHNITELTGITDEMVSDAPKTEQALRKFLEWAGDAVFVAHNANFDMSFVRYHSKKFGMIVNNTVCDTLTLSKVLFKELKKHKLNIVAAHLGVALENHHRAVDDALACAGIFIKSVQLIENAKTLTDINLYASQFVDIKQLKHFHAVILVQNQAGLKNLYELVSDSHLKYFYKRPRIPKSEFIKHRDGLLIGTACEAGEFYRAVRDGADDTRLRELGEFYDYFEIQPNGNNMYMVREGIVPSVAALIDINKKIIEWGRVLKKPVVATGDVHFLDKSDEVFRRVIMAGDGFKDADNQPPLYYRTTDEMLQEFSYLDEETRNAVVVLNPNKIAESIGDVKPIPDETFPPKIDGAEEQIKELATTRAIEIYGDPLPDVVSARLDKELTSIIKNGFSVMYLIAQKLVHKSVSEGYLVGSRGSVGSSFVATMTGITEVNPLSPHYICESCKFSDFSSEEVLGFGGGSGCDVPDRVCPVCGAALKKEGHDIPFETFLGFDGDKEPDIDLNFSGEYQAKAHAYTEELFGEGHVFKAGTIGTLADKTAYGYVRKYMDEKSIVLRGAELNRIRDGCTGIKRTTGQHPGGLMIVPSGHSIYEFCPVQRPANDVNSAVVTTHFDYHSISGRLLKLDLLGHDVPTIIRMLFDMTDVDPTKIDIGDSKIISLFTSTEALGVTPEDINCKTGSLGLPEFGTSFVRQMLLDTLPKSFSDLVRISGLSHGTDVWLNNAQDFIRAGVATIGTIIPTRDDIMLYLISRGVPKKSSFKIMENVRKGKGLKDDEVTLLRENNVPEWYIESCQKIKYLFPKGHAVAYVMMTVRIGYYKIYHPYAFYAATLSVKAEDFDYELMAFGRERAAAELTRLGNLPKEAQTAKDKNTQTILELVVEMYARGLKFASLSLYEAKADKFIMTENGLMPPLCAIQGLGGNVAQNIVAARENGEFETIANLVERTKVNKTVIEILKRVGILDGMSETNQLSLF